MFRHERTTAVVPVIGPQPSLALESATARVKPVPCAAPRTLRLSVAQRRYLLISRGLDITLSVVALVLVGPIMLAAAMAIKLTSKGPVLFRQQRAGQNRRPFRMYKFRTMVAGAEVDKDRFQAFNTYPTGPCFKMVNDPRVTRVGRWLRRTSIDELPQIFNVLKGEMAWVGPRPIPLDEVRTDTPQQRLRFTVKPGITCLWQVSGRSAIPYEEWLALDEWYVRRRSIRLDIEVLARTIPAVLSGRGAW